MESACCNFTHPLTPSREGRGEHILKSFAITSQVFLLQPVLKINFFTVLLAEIWMKMWYKTIGRLENQFTNAFKE
jgi:flavoprotein